MKPRRPALLPPFVALWLAMGPARALALGGDGCPAVAIEPDDDFRSRFPELVERIRGELSARTDIDTCARVELRASDAVITVSVTLPDGRAASRSLLRPDDVVPTLQGLLLVPEPSPAGTSVLAGDVAVPELKAVLPPCLCSAAGA